MGIILNKELVASTSFDKMKTSIYDTKNKQIDIYDYVDSRSIFLTTETISYPIEEIERYNYSFSIIEPENFDFNSLQNEIKNNKTIVLILNWSEQIFLPLNTVNDAGIIFADGEYEATIKTDGLVYIKKKQSIDLNIIATTEYVNNAIAAIPTPDVSGQIESHNTNNEAHPDIREMIAQSDWYQNDETEPDYVKNRTHYSKVCRTPVTWEENTIFDSLTVEFTDGYKSYAEDDTGDEAGPISGKDYLVVWDGVEYTVTAEDTDTGVAIGANNGSLPFYIEYFDWYILKLYAYSGGVQETGTTTHTVSIYEYAGREMELTFTDGRFEDYETYARSFRISAGKIYAVEWDGVEYHVVAKDRYDGIEIYLGGAEIGYPFDIGYGDGASLQFFASAYDVDGNPETGTTTHTISVYELTETVHKLDEKWLSSGSAKPLIVTFSAETSWDEELGESVYSGSADKTFAEIDSAFENGIRVLGRYENGEYTRLFECNTKYHAYGDLYFDFTSTGDQIGGYAIEFEHFRVRDNNTTERVSIKRIPTFENVEIQINAAIGNAIGGSY